MTSRRQFLSSAAAGAAASAAPLPRPNILLVFPDQHRHDWTSANPLLPLRTPHYDALRRRGLGFRQAMVASPLCAPSRACLAAGLPYDRCRVPNNAADYPLDLPTYYSLLREAGYHVMGCGKLDLHKATLDWGTDGQRLLREWGFSAGVDNAGKHDAIRSGRETPRDPYMAHLHHRRLAETHVEDFEARRGTGNYANTAPTPLPDESYCDNWIGDNGLKLLRAAPAGRPWHLVVNFTGPHDPMDITRRMESACRDRRYPGPHHSTQFDTPRHLAIRQNYSAMVENIDRWLGVYVAELRRRGELDNTLIVYSSDHGEMLGDHDRWAKVVPYDASVRVPLTLAGPGVRARGESNALVAVHDLAATFLDVAGVPVPSTMESRSLTPLLAGATRTHREHLHSGLGAWRLVTDGRHKLIRGYDPARSVPQQFVRQSAQSGPYLLFDREADPQESTDLSSRHPQLVTRLASHLTP